MRKSARNHSFTLVVVILLFLFGALYLFAQPQLLQNKSNEIIPIPTPTPKVDSSEVHSEDGTLKITLETVSAQKTLPVAYVYTSDVLGANKKLLFSKTLEAGESLSLPSNSWSPDNKYLFISDWKAGEPGAFVFKATGEPFYGGEAYLDVALLFSKDKRDVVIRDITGWDSPTLIHVQTAVDKNTKGPNFWFDVESKVFLQLAS